MTLLGSGCGRVVGACTAILTCATVVPAEAQTTTGVTAAAPLPLTVQLFSGNNQGATSFFDGFGPQKPGFTFLDYLHVNDFTAIHDQHGDDSSRFDRPYIQSYTNVFHFSYASPLKVPGGLLGAEVLVPVVGLVSGAGAAGQSLEGNGTGFGDVTFGVVYQAFPTLAGHRPVFDWRFAFDVIGPSGGFDPSKDVNQSSGYWTLNPYLAMTWLPAPRWELSSRLQYFHNFSTDHASNPPSFPGFSFRHGRAGDAIEANFAGSYAVFEHFSLGLNGFVLTQVQDNRTNGVAVTDSRTTVLYLGPGFSTQFGPQNKLNFNVYVPVVTRNVTSGMQINMQYIHPF